MARFNKSITGPTRDPKAKLSDKDIEDTVARMIDEAIDFIDDTLAPVREKATDYYMGRPFKNEEEGRSQVVTTTVRDTVQKILPSVMRVLTGPERVVEFRPRSEDDVASARQRTDYINFIFMEENPGFLILHDAAKDACVRKVGIMKWWVEKQKRDETTEYTGLSEQNLQDFLSDENVEVELVAQEEPLARGMPPTFQAEITEKDAEFNHIRVEAVPPEEIVWNPGARSLEDALIVAHTREVRLDELVAMGFDRDELEAHVGQTNRHDNEEASARRLDEGSNLLTEDEQDDATRPLLFSESYVYLDVDGDGVAQLCKVQTVGEVHHLLDWEKVSHRPFAMLEVDPEPHAITGLDVSDHTMDVQLIKSSITRGTLDSLATSIFPPTVVIENQVNIKDVLNTEVGRVIRAKGPNAVTELTHRFVGGDTLPMLDHFDEVVEERLGITKASQGLGADQMQSTTKAAVSATLSAAQQRIEMITRIFAETGMKQLFKGLLRTVVENQNRPQLVRLRGEFVEVDPRSWNADMDVIVNVALGAGLTEEKIAMLQAIASKQEQLIQTMGPGNPIVSFRQLRNTYARIVELAGFKDSTEFFNEITEEQEQQALQAAQQAGEEPSETEALAQAEMAKAQVAAQKVQADHQIALQKLELERERILLEDDRERDKQAAEMTIDLIKAQAAGEISLSREQIDAEFKRQRALLDADTRVRVAEIQKRGTDDSRSDA